MIFYVTTKKFLNKKKGFMVFKFSLNFPSIFSKLSLKFYYNVYKIALNIFHWVARMLCVEHQAKWEEAGAKTLNISKYTEPKIVVHNFLPVLTTTSYLYLLQEVNYFFLASYLQMAAIDKNLQFLGLIHFCRQNRELVSIDKILRLFIHKLQVSSVTKSSTFMLDLFRNGLHTKLWPYMRKRDLDPKNQFWG